MPLNMGLLKKPYNQIFFYCYLFLIPLYITLYITLFLLSLL